MITVRLYGGLQQFGRRFDLHVATPAEAVRALCTQIAGLKKQLSDGLYQVRFCGRDYGEDELKAEFAKPGSGVLHIVPRVAGAGKVGQIIVGAVLLVVSYFVPVLSPYLTPLGIGLIAGGVAQMLTKTPSLKDSQGAESSKNTAFSNLSNLVAQGNPVPVAYGLVYTGSRVVSQGLQTYRIHSTASQSDSGAAARAMDVSFGLQREYVQGVAAVAPNGVKYNTDFSDDSVIAQNYVVRLT